LSREKGAYINTLAGGHLQAVIWKQILGSVYTWRTFTALKLNNNWTQYSRSAIFWQCNFQDNEPELH